MLASQLASETSLLSPRIRSSCCGAPGCEAAIPLPVNALQGSRGSDDEIEWQFIARKLEAKGWQIDIPPLSALFQRHQNEIGSDQEGERSVRKPDDGKAEDRKDNMRVMTREHRRIIFEKLNEVYVSEKVGYGDGWTDEKVAVDLGVPRAWVKLIRDENFGDEVANENIREQVKRGARSARTDQDDRAARRRVATADRSS